MPILRILWSGWKSIAKRIGAIQANILLTIFYFSILIPFALVFKFKLSAKNKREGKVSNWQKWNYGDEKKESISQ